MQKSPGFSFASNFPQHALPRFNRVKAHSALRSARLDFRQLPKKEVYIATGPVPPPLPEDPPPGSQNEPPLTHRYRLLAAKPEVFAGGTLRRVSATKFPISTTMTGALLVIEPGGLRELHWHPHAAEWQYYIKGTGRMTVFGSNGRARTDAFSAGDVGYVPQGYGHYIENTGSADLEVLALFNNGTYESISVTGWMAGNPDLLLSTNFGVPESVFAKFPKDAVIMPNRAELRSIVQAHPRPVRASPLWR